MKKLIALLALVVSVYAQANTLDSVYKKDSPVPAELQKLILDSVNTRCADIISAYGLREVTTTVKVDRVDQGIVDRYFTTVLSSRYPIDGYHYGLSNIEVKTVEYSSQNGYNSLEVLSVKGDKGCR